MDGVTQVALVKMPYSGTRNVPELSPGPDYLEQGGIVEFLEDMDVGVKPIQTIRLTRGDEAEYGEWHRLGLANGHLADVVAANTKEGYLTVGLLANCNSLLGVLGGLQHSGGMPVAVAAGMALTSLRRESGLEAALPTRYIVMAGVRDTDPLEQELLDRSEVEHISVADIRDRSDNLHAQMERLSRLTDIIYIHIDMDVLDPGEVAGHPLTVAEFSTSMELADALTEMFRYETVAALGIASTPNGERDPEGKSRQAAYNLVAGAIEGIRRR